MPELSMNKADQKHLLELLITQLAEDSQAPDIIRRFHSRSTQHPNTLFANLDETEAMTVVDVLLDVFASSGLGEDSEPNGLGLQIERWIDIFS